MIAGEDADEAAIILVRWTGLSVNCKSTMVLCVLCSSLLLVVDRQVAS